MTELQPFNTMQEAAPPLEKFKRDKKKRKSKQSSRKEPLVSQDESTALIFNGITSDAAPTRTPISSVNTHIADDSAADNPWPPLDGFHPPSRNQPPTQDGSTSMEIHPSYSLKPKKGSQKPKKKKSSKKQKKKKSSKKSALKVVETKRVQEDNPITDRHEFTCVLREDPPAARAGTTAGTGTAPFSSTKFFLEFSTAPLHQINTEPKQATKHLSKFQQQQAQIMQEMGVLQEDFGSSSNHDSGELDYSQGGLSCEGSAISDLTFGTYNMGEKAAMLFAEQQTPASKPSMTAPRERSHHHQSFRPLSGVIEKAVILEEYEYDQEFNEAAPPHAATRPPPPPLPPVATRPPVKLEKWEMLSDKFDEAAFGQAVGSLLGSSNSNNYAQSRSAISSKRNIAVMGLQQQYSSAGRAADAVIPNDLNGMTTEEQHSNDLLIMYLQSMGADPHSAKQIAKSFNQQRTMGGGLLSPLDGSISLEQEQTPFAARPYAQYPNESGGDEAIGRKIRMISTAGSHPRKSTATSGNPRASGRRPGGSSLTWDRSERPGAVQVESRAFGAPRRPAAQRSKGPATGTIARMPSESNDEPTSVPTLEAELVVKDLMDDGEGGLDANGVGVVYAESAPMNLKTLIKEKSIRRMFILAAGVFVAIIVITLSVTLTRDSSGRTSTVIDNDVPTGSPTSQPTRIDQEIADVLSVVSGWEALSTTRSPQREALSWLSTFDEEVIETSDTRFIQRYALAVLFLATGGGGESWLEEADWMNPLVHECDWDPSTIECVEDSSKRRIVVSIDLSRNGLVGEMPPEIGALIQLTSLKFSKNALGGSIPGKLFSLSSLKTLEMRANKFTGAIPREISNDRDLAFLDLSFNELSSELPPQLFDLANLFWLDLSFNQLTGTLSTDLGKLKRLTSFNVRHNMIGGIIPPAFDDIPKLDFILLDDNLLTGGLPEWSDALLTRQEMTVSHNQLVGTIPDASSLGDIGGNFLGSIRLKTVDISFNLFVGTVPLIFAFVPSIRLLDLSGNSFYGTFPSSPGFWSGLEHLGLRDNDFEGSVPSGFSDLLIHLDVAFNNMRGEIPVELSNYPNLKYLSLSHNQLSSTIPTEVAEISTLQVFQVRNCSLTGSIPEAFTMYGAEFLDLGLNGLTGSIHSEFGTVASLEKLSLDGNNLVGRIPPDLGSLNQLRVLNLNTNYLSGTIPSRLSLLPNLENFTASNNRLVGSVPKGLCSLLLDLSIDDVGCEIECSCCSGREAACGAT